MERKNNFYSSMFMIPLEIFMCISCSPAGVNVQHVHEVLLEARRGRQSPRERKLEGEVLGTTNR